MRSITISRATFRRHWACASWQARIDGALPIRIYDDQEANVDELLRVQDHVDRYEARRARRGTFDVWWLYTPVHWLLDNMGVVATIRVGGQHNPDVYVPHCSYIDLFSEIQTAACNLADAVGIYHSRHPGVRGLR